MAMRNHSGWGDWEGALSSTEVESLRKLLSKLFKLDLGYVAALPLKDCEVAPSRWARVPPGLGAFADVTTGSRALHSFGRSFADLVRARGGDFSGAPDVVLFPGTESEVVAAMDFAASRRAALVPFGGGSSVVGGLGPISREEYPLVVSLDLSRLGRVVEVDSQSETALIEAGTYGPAIESQLRPHGLSLRHFPQSFEFSSLGGWIATRSGGHFATGPTHIEDLVRSVRMISPVGVFSTRPFPASGAGISPERMVAGSEGILGVITEATMKLFERPRFKSSASVRFTSLDAAISGLAALVRSGLNPANCRVLDAAESQRVGLGNLAQILVGFESPNVEVKARLAEALSLLEDHGGSVASSQGNSGEHDSASEAWKSSFIRAPYLADALIGMGLLVDTYETAVSYANFPRLYAATHDAIGEVLRRAGVLGSMTSCRVTHAYSDGLAPYFTLIAPVPPGAQLTLWREMKEVVSATFVDSGATITHHHGVGRDHIPGFIATSSPLFLTALAKLKSHFDPNGIMNPGVLLG